MIKLVVMDVDGVMTDGKIYISSEGYEMKSFNVKDGFFIKIVCGKLGIKFAIISGGKADAVKFRAKTLDIEDVITECFEKKDAMLSLLKKYNLKKEEVAYIGDDWFDYPAMREAGIKAVPANASEDIKAKADFVCKSNGGDGAIREFLEYILKKDGNWEKARGYFFDE